MLKRYIKNGTPFHYTGTPRVSAPAGFTPEAHTLGKLLANPEPGAMPLYACRLNNSEDHMTSTSSTCEGQTVIGTLGYIFKAKPNDVPTQPLHRCLFQGAHFDSPHANCEGQTPEFQFGWVVT